MPVRAPKTANGDSLQAWSLGGRIERVVLTAGVWTEFVPTAGVDAYLVQTPVTDGRIVHTNSATVVGLLDGAVVTPAHLELSFDVYPGQDTVGIDRDGDVRFFYSLADVVDGVIATMHFMRAST